MASLPYEEQTVHRPAKESLVGRSDELTLIDSVLAGHAPGPALVLRGEPGVGKSALLAAAASSAREAGMTALPAAGAEGESGRACSGLRRMLHPLRDRIPNLPAGQREALRRALAREPEPSTDPLVVSVAALALLDEAATRVPLLLAVDDLQWMDRCSAEVLGFVARRLGPRVRFLGAVRSCHRCFFDRAAIAEREIGPLPGETAGRLLDQRYPGLPASVRHRLLAEAAGNPLALLELPTALSAQQLSGRAPLPMSLPLSRPLERLFADGLCSLPAATRYLLLLAALEGSGTLRTIRSAAGEEWRLDDLVPAERAGLVRLEQGRLVFQHPLIRSAVGWSAAPHEHRSAHQALARALGHRPERRGQRMRSTVEGAILAKASRSAAREVIPSLGKIL